MEGTSSDRSKTTISGSIASLCRFLAFGDMMTAGCVDGNLAENGAMGYGLNMTFYATSKLPQAVRIGKHYTGAEVLEWMYRRSLGLM